MCWVSRCELGEEDWLEMFWLSPGGQSMYSIYTVFLGTKEGLAVTRAAVSGNWECENLCDQPKLCQEKNTDES